MGLTKQYLRYVPGGNFNIIASQNCNVVFVTLEGQEGRFVAAGACEHIVIWDLRLAQKAQILPGEKAVVTALCPSPNKAYLAAGYSDGSVKVYDLKSTEVVNIFQGHRADVTSLAYDSFGHKLASGSKDTDVIVWDTVAESGLYRLRGHSDAVTQLEFMTEKPVLITGSKDTFVKFWDLNTQHCFKTLTGHQTEVWALCLMKDNRYLVTGCGDAELRVWKLADETESEENGKPLFSFPQLGSEGAEETMHDIQCRKTGSVLRRGKGRVISLYGDASGQLVGCHGTDNEIELFHFLSDAEAKVKHRKRINKQMKKEVVEASDNTQMSLIDEVKRLPSIKLSAKPKSFHLVLGNAGELRIAVNLINNQLEMYTLNLREKNTEPKCLRAIESQGHHSEVRSLSFSSDNLAIASGSAESVKLWNRSSQASIRTVSTGYVLSTSFVPGDRYVLAGLKDGRLLIIDIASGDIVEEIPAHETELWSIQLWPDLRGCVTGSGDKTVKFWQFELVSSEGKAPGNVLSVVHTRTLKLEDSVLCVRISLNNKFMAVALLDSTVKIFFVDTFKFYLSLYGHKLPVLCMDISSDSRIIATGSADRNVKIWGMDFGDCHKSIFAHDDSITGLQFVPKTHYFFTCGKDGKVKEWDGDTYDKIITLQGHHGEAWTLAVSPNGNYVVSSGSDRVLRLYEKSEQPLVLQDEQEEEREEMELATSEQTAVPGKSDLNLPSKKTIGSEKGAESILECLEICSKYKEQLAEHEVLQAASTQPLTVPLPPPLMMALNCASTDDFLLETLKRIRASDLEESLLLLPYSAVCEVLENLSPLLSRGDHTELICKIMIFLVKLHHAPIVANHSLSLVLERLNKAANEQVKALRDLIGFNYFGMQCLQREIEKAEGVQFFRDATLEKKKREKSQKKKLKRKIMALA